MRTIDIIFSITALIILFIPCVIVIFILKFYSYKNIFFYQKRVGFGNQEFNIIKFVTMKKPVARDVNQFVTVNNDPRIYPIGRILRNTKINEIPQLINILKGEMSLIGPRPLPRETFEIYPEEVKKEIVKKRPGLSGVGSIIFSEENKLLNRRDNLEFYFNVIQPYKGQLENWFVENYSLFLCLKLLFLTVYKLFFSKTLVHWKLLKELPTPPDKLKIILRYPF